jgi:hypothetical protein
MTWSVIFLSLLFFFFGVILHVTWWRIRRPAQDVPALIGCVIVAPVLGAALFLLLNPDGLRPQEQCLALLLLTALHGVHYLMIYPAWQAASPTVLVVLKMEGGREVTREELAREIGSDLVCEGTLHRLLNEKWIVRSENRVALSPRATFLTGLCRCWRKLLNLPDGPG